MTGARALALLGVLGLSACTSAPFDLLEEEPILEEALPAPEPHAGASPLDLASACVGPKRTTDDGIGGTGCPVH